MKQRTLPPNRNKALGPEGISMMIKKFDHVAQDYVNHLFNISIHQLVIPEILKVIRIFPMINQLLKVYLTALSTYYHPQQRFQNPTSIIRKRTPIWFQRRASNLSKAFDTDDHSKLTLSYSILYGGLPTYSQQIGVCGVQRPEIQIKMRESKLFHIQIISS